MEPDWRCGGGGRNGDGGRLLVEQQILESDDHVFCGLGGEELWFGIGRAYLDRAGDVGDGASSAELLWRSAGRDGSH